MSALGELRRRYEESGHPFPLAAVGFATGGNEERAAVLLAELDTPRSSGAWVGVDAANVAGGDFATKPEPSVPPSRADGQQPTSSTSCCAVRQKTPDVRGGEA